MHVFTYGTLMFPEVWQSVVGRQFATASGHAAGFRVYFVRDAAFPGMVAAAPADAVRGIIHFDVDPESVARLDRFEGDFYERQPIAIFCDNGRRLEAEAYVVPNEHVDVLTNEPWSREEFVARGGLERFLASFAGFHRVHHTDG